MGRRQSFLKDAKVKPTLIVVRGLSQESFVERVRNVSDGVTVTTDVPQRRFSKESMQEDSHNERQAILSLFVYKPKQTGFAATAAMVQSAIQQPQSTVVAVVKGDNESTKDQMEREEIHEILQGTNAPVFDNENEALSYVSQCVDEGIPEQGENDMMIDEPVM